MKKIGTYTSKGEQQFDIYLNIDEHAGLGYKIEPVGNPAPRSLGCNHLDYECEQNGLSYGRVLAFIHTEYAKSLNRKNDGLRALELLEVLAPFAHSRLEDIHEEGGGDAWKQGDAALSEAYQLIGPRPDKSASELPSVDSLLDILENALKIVDNHRRAFLGDGDITAGNIRAVLKLHGRETY